MVLVSKEDIVDLVQPVGMKLKVVGHEKPIILTTLPANSSKFFTLLVHLNHFRKINSVSATNDRLR